MKKVCILFLAFGFLVSACNNNKDKGNTGTKDREKDNYRNTDDNRNDENNNAKWSSKDVRSFNNDCYREMQDKLTEDQLDPFCSCLLGQFQDKYSSFAEFNRESTEDDGTAAAQHCMADLGIKGNKNNDDNTGSGWTRKDEDRFMDECETEARKNVPAARANQYCDCMLQKSKSLFSSYVEADKGLTQLPAGELQRMIDDCNRQQ